MSHTFCFCRSPFKFLHFTCEYLLTFKVTLRKRIPCLYFIHLLGDGEVQGCAWKDVRMLVSGSTKTVAGAQADCHFVWFSFGSQGCLTATGLIALLEITLPTLDLEWVLYIFHYRINYWIKYSWENAVIKAVTSRPTDSILNACMWHVRILPMFHTSSVGIPVQNSSQSLKGICTWFPLTGLDSIVKFWLTWTQFTYSMALDAYHIDSVNTCYD